MSGWNPLIPGAIMSPVGVEALRITTRLMALMSMAW